GVGVDLKLGRLGDSRRVETPAEDIEAACPPRRVAVPDDDEATVPVRCDPGIALEATGVSIDAEFAAQRCSRRVEAPAEDAADVPILRIAAPDDNEVSVGVGGDGRILLLVGGV